MGKRLLLASPHMSDEGYELEYINDAFRKNWIAPLGENVNEFEKAMGEFMGEGYPVALSAGTAALHLAMILVGVKAGDRSSPATSPAAARRWRTVSAAICALRGTRTRCMKRCGGLWSCRRAGGVKWAAVAGSEWSQGSAKPPSWRKPSNT